MYPIDFVYFVGMEVLFKAAMGIKRFTVPEPISFALKLTLRGFWANIKFRDDKK